FEVRIGEEKRFGALLVKPDICYSRPLTEEPKTTSFVEVDEVEANRARKRIFTGWMFAESPGLNAVEHPVFDVWLTDCEKPKGTVVQSNGDQPADASQAPPPARDTFEPRRRVRR